MPKDSCGHCRGMTRDEKIDLLIATTSLVLSIAFDAGVPKMRISPMRRWTALVSCPASFSSVTCGFGGEITDVERQWSEFVGRNAAI